MTAPTSTTARATVDVRRSAAAAPIAQRAARSRSLSSAVGAAGGAAHPRAAVLRTLRGGGSSASTEASAGVQAALDRSAGPKERTAMKLRKLWHWRGAGARAWVRMYVRA